MIVDDATHEAIAVMVERCMGGEDVTRILDGVCSQRGHPAVIRTDNGAEFCGKAMLNWVHRNAVTVRPIEPGKLNQNAYVESFNGRLRDECLNEHWFATLTHALCDLTLAPRVQRRATEKNSRWADARRLCEMTGREARYMYNAW